MSKSSCQSIDESLQPKDWRRRDKDGNIFKIKVTTITGPQASAIMTALKTGCGIDHRNNSVEGMPILDLYI